MVSKTASQSVGSGGFVKTNPNNSKIKQIVETTRCTRAEAEEALHEVGGELESACSWVLDHASDNVWTQKKGRKATNKKPENGAVATEVKPETKKVESGAAGTAPAATTGTGQAKQDRPPRSDHARGGERRGGGNFRGGNRGGGNRPGWNNKKPENGNGAAAAPPSTEVKPETKKDEPSVAAPATTNAEVKHDRPPRTDHGRGDRRGGGNYRGGNRGGGNRPAWKAGQVFHRSEPKPTSPPATTEETTPSPPVAPAPTPVQPEVIKTAAGPLSFAAVCAARLKKSEFPASPTTTTTQASSANGGFPELVSSEPQQIVESTPFEAEQETSAELEAATPEVHADDEALPEASAELEAANPEIQTEIEPEETLQETADEPRVSTPDHLEQVGHNAWNEKFYMEKAAPPAVEIRKTILSFSDIQTYSFFNEKPVVKAAALPSYTPPVSTPSTPAVFNSTALPAGFAHSSYYHPAQTQQVPQQQQQPVLSQSQQQQIYNPLHYSSFVPPPPGLSGPNNHLYHNQQYPNMHYYTMPMGHQMYPTGNAATTNQVQNRRYDTNQHAGAGHNNMQQHHYAQWNA